MNELIEMLRSCGNKYCADCPEIEECAGPNYLLLKAAEELEKSEPVVHARWVWASNGYKWRWECSNCHLDTEWKEPRCSKCGAHMDEEVANVR